MGYFSLFKLDILFLHERVAHTQDLLIELKGWMKTENERINWHKDGETLKYKDMTFNMCMTMSTKVQEKLLKFKQKTVTLCAKSI